MNSFLFTTAILAAVVFYAHASSQIGSVTSYAQFSLHNQESVLDAVGIVNVSGTVTYDDVEEFLTNFTASKETKILIHGWLNSHRAAFAEELIGAYLPAFDYNVIFVDWSPQAYQFYPRAVQAVSKIATLVAGLVDILVENYSVSLDSIHIVGHSLGAHIAGVAGLSVSSGQVARVTGLDPAKPLFSLAKTNRLREESAVFVDVIHTCSNILSFSDQLGHVDFYPNGGKSIQPGCTILTDLLFGTCSHGLAYTYFAESITYPENFVGTLCDSYDDYDDDLCAGNSTAYMGESVSTSASGTYYLDTASTSPYGLGSAS